MPNHVANTVYIDGAPENVKAFRDAIRGNEKVIDFNALIPMPEEIYRGDLGPEEREKYGADNWYDWSIGHWGTKWNAYEQTDGIGTIDFWTAWTAPIPIYFELCKKANRFHVNLTIYWSNEDIGSGTGKVTMTDSGGIYIDEGDSREEDEENYAHAWGEPYVEDWLEDENN